MDFIFAGKLILLVNKVLNFHFNAMPLLHTTELFIRPTLQPPVGTGVEVMENFCREEVFRSEK